MAITPEEVRRVAALARLRLDDAEAVAMAGELGAILEHVRVLQRADGRDEVPGGAEERTLPLRADAYGADLLHRSPDMIAPAWEDGFFVVPRLPALDADARRAGDGAP
jgi:aspartyl-tRNA(Asn)/glutamyl-tRNA(Gln) amidotransferase subunit C